MAAGRPRSRDPERRMSLGEHLVELRRRLTFAGLGIVAGAIAGWFLAEIVWDALRIPILAVATDHEATPAVSAIHAPRSASRRRTRFTHAASAKRISAL